MEIVFKLFKTDKNWENGTIFTKNGQSWPIIGVHLLQPPLGWVPEVLNIYFNWYGSVMVRVAVWTYSNQKRFEFESRWAIIFSVLLCWKSNLTLSFLSGRNFSYWQSEDESRWNIWCLSLVSPIRTSLSKSLWLLNMTKIY